MCLFIETVRIEYGQIVAPDYHDRRMNNTRHKIFGVTDWLEISAFIQPEEWQERTKCRVEYGKDSIKVEYQPYQIRPVHSLKLVRDDQIEYPYKSTDRRDINRLFGSRGECEDVLIVRNGRLTDTSICNVAFFNGKEWLTPEQPLLEGTARARLLDQGMLQTADIQVQNLCQFTDICLFNAMIEFGEIEFSVSKLYR